MSDIDLSAILGVPGEDGRPVIVPAEDAPDAPELSLGGLTGYSKLTSVAAGLAAGQGQEIKPIELMEEKPTPEESEHAADIAARNYLANRFDREEDPGLAVAQASVAYRQVNDATVEFLADHPLDEDSLVTESGDLTRDASRVVSHLAQVAVSLPTDPDGQMDWLREATSLALGYESVQDLVANAPESVREDAAMMVTAGADLVIGYATERLDDEAMQAFEQEQIDGIQVTMQVIGKIMGQEIPATGERYAEELHAAKGLLATSLGSEEAAVALINSGDADALEYHLTASRNAHKEVLMAEAGKVVGDHLIERQERTSVMRGLSSRGQPLYPREETPLELLDASYDDMRRDHHAMTQVPVDAQGMPQSLHDQPMTVQQGVSAALKAQTIAKAERDLEKLRGGGSPSRDLAGRFQKKIAGI